MPVNWCRGLLHSLANWLARHENASNANKSELVDRKRLTAHNSVKTFCVHISLLRWDAKVLTRPIVVLLTAAMMPTLPK